MCNSLTNHFDLDKKIEVIRCNSRKTNKKGYRRKVVLISNSESRWTNTYKDEVEDNVGFRTEFKLFRSEHSYLLQVIGISNSPNKFPAKYKVILFSDPSECLATIEDTENHDLYMSEPVLDLLDKIQNSEYLTSWEKERWDDCLIDSEE